MPIEAFLTRFARLTVIVAAVALLPTNTVLGQNANSFLQRPPRFILPEPVLEMVERTQEDAQKSLVPEYVTATASSGVQAEFNGRVAVLSDDTRLSKLSGGGFLPSAIPAVGDPYFGSGQRVQLLGAGNAANISGYVLVNPDVAAVAHTQLLLTDTSVSASGETDANIVLSQAFVELARFKLGVMESAFADYSAVPGVLDLAGPNARVTAFPGGIGEGIGRVSYDVIAAAPEGGTTATVSFEQPQPLIVAAETEDTFARYPDVVFTARYVALDQWHVQIGSVLRDLGIENETATLRDEEFGWGISLSGSYMLSSISPGRDDRFVFSVTHGEGISRYIADLNSAVTTNDATVDVAGALTPLPVLAWYAGYTHNWSANWCSTAVYSQVTLDSVEPLNPLGSPYLEGEFVAVNLVYHRELDFGSENMHDFYTGVEYLFGSKETFDGDGDAFRVMWVMSISKR